MGIAARVGKVDTVNSKKLLVTTEYLSITQKSIIIDFTCINIGYLISTLGRPRRMGIAARVGKSDTLNSKKLLTTTGHLSITQKSIIIDFTCINIG